MAFSLHLFKPSFLPPPPTARLSAFDSYCPEAWGISTLPTGLSPFRSLQVSALALGQQPTGTVQRGAAEMAGKGDHSADGQV